MQYPRVIPAILLALALAASACGSAAPTAAFDCPVTIPPNPAFIPSPPSPELPPTEGRFWVGSDALFTELPSDGRWDQLALGEKVFWWSEDYSVDQEPMPTLTITARRLDGPAPDYLSTKATNASHASFGRTAMLVGVTLGASGCWEVSGTYRGETLSFVVWVEP